MTDTRTLEQAKRDHIELHLRQAKGNMKEAADTLALSSDQIYRMVRAYGIDMKAIRKGEK